MKGFLPILLSTCAFADATASRLLAQKVPDENEYDYHHQALECHDDMGKFYIKEINSHKNCQYVKNTDMDLCIKSDEVKFRCQQTCNNCPVDTHGGHDHDHSEEHLLMSCDVNDDLYVEHIEEIEKFCTGVINGNDASCPYKCLQPMAVLHMFYGQVCPEMEHDATYAAVDVSGKCHDYEHSHEKYVEVVVDENEHDDHHQKKPCHDEMGRFFIEEIGSSKNCQYVKNKDMDLCNSSDEVKFRCQQTCNNCPTDHHGDHDHSEEHLLMSCDVNDDLYVEHIKEIQKFCTGVVDGDDASCPFKCMQPMAVLHMFYDEVCPGMEHDATYVAIDVSGKCHDYEHSHGDDHHKDEDDHHGDHDDHDHSEEHLLMSCDVNDDLYVEHIEEIEKFCTGVVDGNDASCPFKCMQPMAVLHMFYGQVCPEMEHDATYAAVDASRKCHDYEHSHEQDQHNEKDEGHHGEPCHDEMGRFFIEEIGSSKNCQYVKNKDMDLCNSSDEVMSRCQQTCNNCPTDHHGDHDDHDHSEEHLLMSCDVNDDLYVEHIEEIEKFCTGVINGNDASCPYKCLQPMAVLHMFYGQVCPEMEHDATYAAVDASRKCHDYEHSHEQDQHNEKDEGHHGEPCHDEMGRFFIEEIGSSKNCQYVKNKDMDLCNSSDEVMSRCQQTCNNCPTDHHGDHDDHDHSEEHLLMSCDVNDDLYVEHIEEIEKFCTGVVDGNDASCPFKCMQPMAVLHMFYDEVCPEMEHDAMYAAVDASGKCHDYEHSHGDDHHKDANDHDESEIQAGTCVDSDGKFRIKTLPKNENGKRPKKGCWYVNKKDRALCEIPKVKKKCRNTCNAC